MASAKWVITIKPEDSAVYQIIGVGVPDTLGFMSFQSRKQAEEVMDEIKKIAVFEGIESAVVSMKLSAT